MIMDLGAGTVKAQVGIGKMNDALWHSVLLHREGRIGRVSVDGFGIEFSLPGLSRIYFQIRTQDGTRLYEKMR